MSDPATCLTRPATAALQHAFVAIMPRIVRHARISFRHMACGDARENAVAETVALTWKWFVGLVQKGKHPEEFVSVLAAYAARAVKSGRRLCGQEKSKDVLSPLANRKEPEPQPLPPTSRDITGTTMRTRLRTGTHKRLRKSTGLAH